MADTAANQKEYPQHQNQKLGCGFPIAKLVVMFSLTTAAAIGVRIAAIHTSEITLARSWYSTLKPFDVAARRPSLWQLCGLGISPATGSFGGVSETSGSSK